MGEIGKEEEEVETNLITNQHTHILFTQPSTILPPIDTLRLLTLFKFVTDESGLH